MISITRLYPKIFFFILSIVILLLAFYITKPFLPALFTGAIIAYLSSPLHIWLLRYVKNRNLASLIVTVFIVLVVTLPLIIALGLLSAEAYNAYSTLREQNLGTNFLKIACNEESWLSCKAVNWLIGFLPDGNVDYYLQAVIERILVFITQNISEFAVSVPSILLNFFVLIFVVYYLLKDGESITAKIKNILPLKESQKRHVLGTFHSAAYGVFYGNISIAAIQGVLGGIGFLLLGVHSPFLWGFVMGLFALVPYFGTAIIWLPAALNLIFIGYLQNDNSSTIRGIVLIIYGIFIISSIDNILKPKLIGTKAKIHPIFVLIGILGGLSLFGFLGLILGPVMLALLVTLADIYEEEKTELEK